jgi:carbazole 1,9a-dioxygenase terminal dioxygenase component
LTPCRQTSENGEVSAESEVPSAADAESSEVGTATRGSWASYVEARLGFRNYWYPALYRHELDDGQAKGVRLLGENVLLRRVGDRVAAVQDRCLHRGVRFSRKPECYTADTITCWYHGFTYSLLDGKLVDILTEPGSKMIGKIGIRTYPVAEAKGIVFVFIGDAEPPELRADVPPGFLDDGLAVHGLRDEVQSNWRIGAENGFDTTGSQEHLFKPDACIVEWRKLAAKYHRGIQPVK